MSLQCSIALGFAISYPLVTTSTWNYEHLFGHYAMPAIHASGDGMECASLSCVSLPLNPYTANIRVCAGLQ